MTPAARCQAAIELLETLEASDIPADALIGGYFRARRYAGSGDRRAIQALIYTILRKRHQIEWWCNQCEIEISPRSLILTALALTSVWEQAKVEAAFAESPHGPSELTSEEENFRARLAVETLDHPDQPKSVKLNIPTWLESQFSVEINNSFDIEINALDQEAAVDLRVNTLKTDRASVLAALQEAGIEATPTPYAPHGIRLRKRQPLSGLAAFRAGHFEPQGEASQLASALTGAAPGHSVLDVCAGAGGKALAIASEMQNQGRLVLMDTDANRLGKAVPRLDRAGVSIAETKVISNDDQVMSAFGGECFDIVLIDAPCSGSGTWQRNPEAKWRLTVARLDALCQMQKTLLQTAAGRVRPGGRLIYMTCSLLAAENRDQVDAFLTSATGEFSLISMSKEWARATGQSMDISTDDLLLTPARHNTDGFYIAALSRAQP